MAGRPDRPAGAQGGGGAMKEGAIERLGGIACFLFVATSLTALVLQMSAGLPPSGESAPEVAAYFARLKPAARTGFFLLSQLSLPLQVIAFTVLFRRTLREASGSVGPIVGLVSAGVAAVAAWGVANDYTALAWYAAEAGDSATLRVQWMQYHLAGFGLGLTACLVLAGFGHGLWLAGRKGAGALGLAAALVNVIEFVVDGARGGVASPLGLLTYLLFLSWVITVGVGLVRRTRPLETGPAAV